MMSEQGRTRGGTGTTVLVCAVLGLLVVALAIGLWSRRGGGAPPGPTGSGAASETARASLESARAVLDTAERMVAENKPEVAATVLRTATAQFPEDQALRIALADLLAGVGGDLTGAYEQYEAALAIGPREHGLEFDAGRVAAAIGRHDRAVEHFSAARADEPTRSDYALHLARAQMAVGALDEAKATLVLLVAQDADSALGWGMLAELALRENALGMARQHAGKARALQPEEPAWRVIEARAMVRDGEPETALLVLAGIGGDAAWSGPVLSLKGQALGLLGRPADAAAMYDEACGRRPGEAELWRESAAWHERAGDASRARASHERAEALESGG